MKKMPQENQQQPGYSFYQNTGCEYFPCHKTPRPEAFNCLFCYCPLYALGERCGGAYAYTEAGVKDCSNCLLPHDPGGYERVTGRFSELAALAARKQPGGAVEDPEKRAK